MVMVIVTGDDIVENEVILMIILMKTLRMVMLRMKSVLNWKIYGDEHSSLSSTTTVQK